MKFSVRCSVLALSLPLFLAACGGGSDLYTPRIVSSVAQTIEAVPSSSATLLTHTMQAVAGGETNATSLLFVPSGTPPAGGWPLVAWAHGTTSVAKASCAPSQTPQYLDGGLTAEGFPSNYAAFIASLVGAGYAVVAPDFEGLGPAASGKYPYYNSASESRSLISAARSARIANPSIASRWAVVGHSEGARGALAMQDFLGEATDLDFRGTVALAPFVSMAAAVDSLGGLATADPTNAPTYRTIQNLFVAMLTTAARVVTPTLDVATTMGTDLAALMPVLQNNCIFASFGTFAQTIAPKAPGSFEGFRADWASASGMKEFLATNDVGASSSFSLKAPTLIAQGTNDIFVLKSTTDALVSKLGTQSAPTLTYKTFPGADHGTIITQATPEVLAFLAARLR
ncbi:MAG: alpha/beta hydrolase family protein [Burkholderiaceae bacterium]